MSIKRTVWVGLLAPLMLAGCLMVPGPHGGVSFVPLLPPVVELGVEPYYVHQGFFYHYVDNGWFYAKDKRGPWLVLPKDHYPKEVKFKKK